MQSFPLTIIGLDLAWGETNRDGVARITFPQGLDGGDSEFTSSLTHGDEALFEAIDGYPSDRCLLAIDAPTLAPNETGSRPVDRECSRLFRKQEAGCHPVNRRLCRRPLRVAAALQDRGFVLSPDVTRSPRTAVEVYPHPAMVRWFGLEKTLKYKRGRVAQRRAEFARYQSHLGSFLHQEFPSLLLQDNVQELLTHSWTKDYEDRLDALLCALIGWWHLRFNGKESDVLGNENSGHILIPKSLSSSPGVAHPRGKFQQTSS